MPRDKGESELIVYRGIKFRRYPKSLQWSTRNYYTPAPHVRRQGVETLHREIWKDAHGPIPDGCEIHHKDGNPLNNSLDNLECVTADEHKAIHQRWEESEQRKQMRASALPKAREAARAWHASEAGREWHRELGRLSWENPRKIERTCDQCGKPFDAYQQANRSRFCSPTCKTAWRYHAGIDNEQRVCAHCGKSFAANKYSPRRFCSRSCSSRARSGGSRDVR